MRAGSIEKWVLFFKVIQTMGAIRIKDFSSKRAADVSEETVDLN